MSDIRLRVITGTIVEAKDTFGWLRELKDTNCFTRWVLTQNGWIKKSSSSVSNLDKSGKFTIIQPTGSGKTVLEATYLFQTHIRGGNIGGNFSLKWTKNNEGKEEKDWVPTINSMEDLEAASHIHIGIDDIRRTIISWNSKDAKMVSEVANAGGKKQNQIDITTQRIENFVPPDLMMLCDEIIVPYIRVIDRTQPSPRNQGKPIQILALRFSPGREFLGYKVYNYNNDTGEEILKGFNTLQIATGLTKGGEGSGCGKPGWELECMAFDYLTASMPGVNLEHLNGKIFDIVSPTHAFDVIGTDVDGNGYTQHKTWAKLLGAARRTNRIPYIMFKYGESWGFIRIKPDLPEGQHLNFSDSSIYNRIKRLKSVLDTKPHI